MGAPDSAEAEYGPAIETANRGQREEALAMFRAIFERTHAPRAQARMGMTEIQLGRWLAAEEHLRSALAVEQDVWVVQHRVQLEDAFRRVQQNLADLDVTCPVAGAALTVDGQPAGTLPLARAVRVVRGDVTIDVTAPGYEAARRVVAVTSASVRAQVTLAPRVESIAGPITAPDPGRPGSQSLPGSSPGDEHRALVRAIRLAADPGAGVVVPRSSERPGWLVPTLVVAGAVAAVGLGIGIWAAVREPGDGPTTTTGWTFDTITVPRW